jgi:PAS domain S-box-containing protein
VSAQQQALAALENSSLRYRSVVSSLSEGVMLQGPDGRVTTTNGAAGHILGRFTVQLLGTTGFDPAWLPIREDGTPFPIDALPGAEAQRTGLEQHNVVVGIHYRPHAAPIWLSLNAVPIKRVGNDLIQGVVTSFTDITERKQMADALKQASEDRRLAVVLRDASDAISLTAMDGRILAWNPASQRLYGWSEAEALGMTLLDRVPPAQRQKTLNELAEMSLAKKIQPYQSQRLTKDGAILDVSVTATALLDEAGKLYAIAATERLLKEDHHER